MTHMIQNRLVGVASRMARAGKTAMLILPLGLALSCLNHQTARAEGVTCGATLDALMSDWRSVGYAEPSKPGQMIVSGQRGYTTTAGHYNYMRQQIREAARECEAGREIEARQHIAMVRANLTHDVQFNYAH